MLSSSPLLLTVSIAALVVKLSIFVYVVARKLAPDEAERRPSPTP